MSIPPSAWCNVERFDKGMDNPVPEAAPNEEASAKKGNATRTRAVRMYMLARSGLGGPQPEKQRFEEIYSSVLPTVVCLDGYCVVMVWGWSPSTIYEPRFHRGSVEAHLRVVITDLRRIRSCAVEKVCLKNQNQDSKPSLFWMRCGDMECLSIKMDSNNGLSA